MDRETFREVINVNTISAADTQYTTSTFHTLYHPLPLPTVLFAAWHNVTASSGFTWLHCIQLHVFLTHFNHYIGKNIINKY